MNKRLFLLIAFLALAFMAIKNFQVQARLEQTLLSGWAKLTNHKDPGKCITPDRLRICWDRASAIQIETNDPRLTGEASFVFDSFTTKVPYTERVKGDFRLDNGGGSWVGTWQGSTAAQGYTLFTAQGKGSGDYEGLAVRWQMERSNSNWWEPMRVSGTID